MSTQPRPPIVAILGHVDHGKTTLLDYIRSSRIAAKEHGAITQKIGAYEISTKIKGYKTDRITFIDTPGHEAFSLLRMRGANVADIALLVIDAKDSLKPQTIESISHINNANIPYIVVINKIDLAEANPEKVKTDLLKHQVIVEDKGGQIPVVAISAKTGQGINNLLELILLVAADLNISWETDHPLQAYIIEAKKDRRGITTSVIVKDGQIAVGQIIYTTNQQAKVRALINDLGRPIKQASPSTPVEILGLGKLPAVGELISTDPKLFSPKKTVVSLPEKDFSLESVLQTDNKNQSKLKIIVKTDNQGSLEAVTNALATNKNLEIIFSFSGKSSFPSIA